MNQAVSKFAFDAEIAASRDNSTALSEIEVRLRSVSAPWAGPMRLRVINLRLQLKQSKNSPPSLALSNLANKSHAGRWGVPYGLPPPDGRQLYRYRLTSDAFSGLGKDLRVRSRRDGFSRREDEALFVLWAAEWFRRSFKGGLRRWSDIGEELALRLSQAEWRALTDRGLAAWGLRPLRLNGITHRLLNLARQGGFPVAAIEDDGSGWVAAYLGHLVGVLLAEAAPDADTAFGHAQALGGIAPAGWQYDDFFAVSADLGLSIVLLRREAEGGGLLAGLPASTWLDAHRPDWRERLPLSIDTDGSRRLIDGLMKAAVVRGGSGAVRVTRILRRTSSGWQPELQFELNGRLRGADLALLDNSWSRLRMFATGRLARYVPGELAVLEPGEGGEWVASSRTLEPMSVPFDVAAEAELRGGGERVGPTILLGQGAPIRSSLLVCRASDDAGEGLPERLELIGTASGSFRPDPLYLLLGYDWKVESVENGEQAEPLGDPIGGNQLWRLTGGGIVSSPEGDRYRLLAGQNREERDTLTLSGPPVPTLASVDGLPVYLGMPTPLLREHGRERAAMGDEVWYRPVGTRDWRLLGRRQIVGAYDLAWRDGTGLVRDRQAAVILPSEFQFVVQKAGDYTEVSISQWGGSAELEPGSKIGEKHWRVRARGAHEAHVTLRLDANGSSPLCLEAWLPHRAWLCNWDGHALPDRGRIALTDLYRLVARAEGRCELTAQLLDHQNRRVPQADMRWTFERELPLTTLAADLTALLRPLGDIDARVELSFNEAYQICWYVCEFDISLSVEPRGIVPTKAIADTSAEVIGRPLHEPQFEQSFGQYGLAADINHRPIAIPPLEGTWLIYLKINDRVLTRPHRQVGGPLRSKPSAMLGEAMSISDRLQRTAALEAVGQVAEGQDEISNDVLRSIVALATSLGGLPPSTFDVFQLVALQPLLAVRLLFEASEQELPTLLALEAGLPFAWPLIPIRYWERAAQLRFETLLAALPETISDRMALAASAIAGVRARIAALDSTLAPLLNQPRPDVSLADAAQAFMHRAHDRAEVFTLSPFRPQLTSHLPEWVFNQSYWRAMDAPCAAARAAREEVSLNPAQIRCVKDIARRHPRYFMDAYAAVLKEPQRE